MRFNFKILFLKKTAAVLALVIFGGILFTAADVFAQENGSLYQNSLPKDTDGDGLTDQGENVLFKTNPTLPDTDGDGFLDSTEVLLGSDPLNPADPIDYLSSQKIVSQTQEIPWPWYVTRASGLTAYFLAFLIMVFGIGIQTRLIYKVINPLTALAAHRFVGIALSVTILTHVVSLLFDKFLKFTILDLLVPFASPYKPLLVSLGIIAFYLFSAVIITSLFLRLKWPRFWRLLHYLTYLAFILFFLHGVLIGTDKGVAFMIYSYWITGAIVSVLFVYRLARFFKIKKQLIAAKQTQPVYE